MVWTSQSRAKGKGRAKEGRYYWLGMRELCLIQRCEVKGYAVAALEMVIDYGFRVLGLDEWRIAAIDENLAMRGLMEKRFGLVGGED